MRSTISDNDESHEISLMFLAGRAAGWSETEIGGLDENHSWEFFVARTTTQQASTYRALSADCGSAAAGKACEWRTGGGNWKARR